MGEGLVADVRRIAVLRANAIGDLVMALPAMDSLRLAYPGAEIVLLGRDWQERYLSGRPSPIDRVIPIPHGVLGDETAPGQVGRDEHERFWRAMDEEHFDIALQMHGGGRNSNPFLLRFHARLTAGTRTPDAIPLDRWIPYDPMQHETLRYLEVASLVGAPPVALEPRIAVTDADREEAAGVVPDDPAPLLVIHPGATDARRRWPPERFAAVGDRYARDGWRVSVTGSEAERHVVRAVIEGMECAALDVADRLSLGGLTGLLASASLVVSNDTGPAHIARAVGAPLVAIYWVGNLINAGPLTRRRTRPLVAWQTRCSECGADNTRARCPHDHTFVGEIAVDDVLGAAAEIGAGVRQAVAAA